MILLILIVPFSEFSDYPMASDQDHISEKIDLTASERRLMRSSTFNDIDEE